jgi:threonine aldolase
MLVPFADPAGRMNIDELETFLTLPKSLRPRLLSIENTHNSSGGLALSVEEIHQYHSLARRHGLYLHMDGSRIFNAAVALKVPASDLARYADSVTFCLSKGLSAPVGSIIAGSREFITRARDNRFQLGGQMRQAGIIAAAGLVAMDTILPQLERDHQNAHFLAMGLAAIEGIKVNIDLVQTNIVLFDVSNLVSNAQEFEEQLEVRGVFASVFSHRLIRFITYRDIGQDEINKVLRITSEVAEGFQSHR